MKMRNICVICGYKGLDMPMYVNNELDMPNFILCDCCGFESGYDDLDQGCSFEGYRKNWIENGYNWFSNNKPHDWNASKLRAQLGNIAINLDDLLNKK